MKLKLSICIFFILQLGCLFGQFTSEIKNEINYPFLVTDTIQYSHSKYNKVFIGQQIYYYHVSKLDYELIESSDTIKGYNSVIDSIISKYFPMTLELVPDYYEGHGYHYDPHSLFLIKIKDNYSFLFPEAHYRIFYKDLIFGISLIEAYPNAFKHFRGGKCSLIIYKNDQITFTGEFEEFIPFNKIKSAIEDADKFELIIKNEYMDEIKMFFHIYY